MDDQKVSFYETQRFNIITSNAQDILLQLKGILPEAIQRPFSKKAFELKFSRMYVVHFG